MGEHLAVLGVAAAGVLVSALAAWLLQRNSQRMHPAVTALLTTVVLVVLEIIVIGGVVLHALASINEATPNPVSNVGAPAVTLLILGIPLVIATLVLGFPAAWAAALYARKRPAED